MELILDIINKVDDKRRFELCGHFKPDDSETDLYAGMVEAQRGMASADSALRVKDDTLIINKIAIADCKAVLDTFKRNFSIDITCSTNKHSVIVPEGSDTLVKMELNSR